VPERPKGAVC